MKSRKRLGVGVLFAALVLVVLLAASYTGSGRSLLTIHTDKSQWKEQIARIGAQAAYNEFAVSVASSSIELQHTGAHDFGAALFDQEGMKGLAICDARFSYGCFHEFLGRAISKLGLGAVERLNQGCMDALPQSVLSCQHGIGHGVLAYLGYDEKALSEALQVCHGLPYNDPIGGCYGGVFMEYNVRTMLGRSGALRDIQSDTMLAPCDSLSEEYASACYFWQPQLWHQTFIAEGATTSVAFKRMGSLCESLKGDAYLRDCFEGIGNIIAPSADFDGRKAAILCDSTSADPENRLFCRSYAANSLFNGGAGGKGDADAVCAGLSGSRYAYCEAYAHNQANILNQLPDSEL